jgi:hypothetical protein
MDRSIRNLQIAALSVVTIATGLAGYRAMGVTAQAKEKPKAAAAPQLNERNESANYGRYLLSL